MSTILVTVGAQADASFSRVFAPLLEASGRARVRVTSDAANAGKAQEREFNRVANQAKAAYKAVEAASARAAAKEVSDAQKAAQAKVAAEQRAFDAKLRGAQKSQADQARAAIKAQADQTRAATKAQSDLRRLAEQAERESTKIAQREAAQKDRLRQSEVRRDRQSFDQRLRESKRAREREEREIIRDARNAEKSEARQTTQDTRTRADRIKDVARGSMRNMVAVGGAAANLGKDGFRAAGVNFDVGTLMQRGIDLESSATSTTISAATGKGKIATAGDISGTVDAIKGAGNASKQDYGSIAAGLSDFVSKSGDLDTGKAALSELGLIARATSADVGDLVSAAGDVSKTLGEVGEGKAFATTEEKAARLLAIMRVVAKQGAMGSVEIKDLARYMGNITASAFMFEGSLENNIGILGGLAQVSMKGGATTAAEGTRAANSFSRDITKEAALKRFKGAGIDVWADADHKKLKSPEKIITQFMEKTGGSLDDLASLFQNEMSKKVLKGYSQIYDEAGGGAAGIEAIKAKFAQMSQGMTAEEVRSAANVSMSGKAAQAQEFQNKLEDLGMELAGKLLPSLMQLTPTILKLADAFVKVVAWAAENPGKAILAAIVGSIAKAAIGNAVGVALTNALNGGGVGGAGGKLLGGGKGGAGGLGALGVVGAVIAAGYTANDAYGKYKAGDSTGATNSIRDSGLMTATGNFGVGPGIGGVGAGYGGAAASVAFNAPPPTGGQPAGAPPTLTAPAPNPIPKLDEVVAQGRATVAAINDLGKSFAAGGAAGASGITTARTGPGKK